MKILGFAGSNSIHSINKKLVAYILAQFKNKACETELLDLNDYPLPLYSIDLENAQGIPSSVKLFSEKIVQSDLLVISLAEHNGAYTAAFKNLFDWLSRQKDVSTFQGKPIFLCGTSPGGRGAKSVLEMAEERFPRNDGKVIKRFSLPRFYESFKENEMIDEELNQELMVKINDTYRSLNLSL